MCVLLKAVVVFTCSSSAGPQYQTAAAEPGQQLTSKQRKQQQEAQLTAKQQQQQQATLPGVSTRGLAEAGFGDQAQAIDKETAQQDQYLDQISQGLDQLKAGAQVREMQKCLYHRVNAVLVTGLLLLLQCEWKLVASWPCAGSLPGCWGSLT